MRPPQPPNQPHTSEPNPEPNRGPSRRDSELPVPTTRAVFLTAGAAGMYCGSCMHDNSLAKALRDRGVDCLLQPIYTPIRTDESSIASDRVFFGGVHIYLLQRLPWLRLVPRPLRRWLDWPLLIRLATRRVRSTDPAQLGTLTISMLRGLQGAQREEVARLVDWLAREMKPDAILLTNLLIGGVLPSIRAALPKTRLIVILQGDDIFLDYLPEKPRAEAIALCRDLARHVDRFVVNSRFYRDKMAQLFGLPVDKFDIVPLSIDHSPFSPLVLMPLNEIAPDEENQVGPGLQSAPDTVLRQTQMSTGGGEFRIGYLARISPEKGLHHLVDAFVRLGHRAGYERTTLHAAGWLGETHQGYLDGLRRRVEDAGLGGRFTYHGSPDLVGKAEFLRSLDVLSVPTDYADPKGLFVLEALAAGVPVIQPDHGAFPELIESTGGGLLFRTGDVESLCESIHRIKTDEALRHRLGQQGRQRVLQLHGIETAAERMGGLLIGTPLGLPPAAVTSEKERTEQRTPLRDGASVHS